jgi:uncharacterized protein (UPF0332 family)
VTPDDYIAKARRAAASARLLLQDGDTEGSCNRAYYARFDAAHAALLWSGAHASHAETKKHTNLIAAFGRHLVQTGMLPADLGKALNKAERARVLADYTGDPIEPRTAEQFVGLAEQFITTVTERFTSRT